MAAHQTVQSSEFLVEFDDSPDALPRVRQLEQALRSAVRGGRLGPAVRLPASRTLAHQLGCSRWMVVEAYEQLVAEGYLSSRTGAGTQVVELHEAKPVAVAPAVAPTPTWVHDFQPGVPDLSSFPRDAWLRSARVAVNGAPTPMLDYADPAGVPTLRHALADYLGRVRGVATDPARVMISSGTTPALGILAQALVDQGITRIGVENPGWIPLRSPLRRSGVEPVPLPVDGQGLIVEALAEQGLRAALVTPAHQFPTGTVLSASRRAALLGWAHRVDGLILEDDYDAEYRYGRSPLGALQGLAGDHVVYLGSVSKTLAPSLRLGWMVCPSRWVEPVLKGRRGTDLGVSVLEQLTLAEMLTSGRLDKHLRRMRRHYRERREMLLAALITHLPGARAGGVPAGLHIPVTLDRPVDEQGLLAVARRDGVRIALLADFYAGGRLPEDLTGAAHLVLGFGGIPARRINEGVARLSAALDEVHASRRGRAGTLIGRYHSMVG